MRLPPVMVAAIAASMAVPQVSVRSTASREPQRERPQALRVCADPNNLPFSNDRREGFEIEIAELIGRDLKLPVEYTWWAQRRGYVRNTLRAGMCDLIVSVATGVDMLQTTTPYYRSSYVFVYRKDRGLRIHSLDSPELRKLRIGVQIIGDDYTNTPPAHALARRNIIHNVRGYRVLDDYARPNPPARIIEAVAKNEVDVAIAWGPLAGYFARQLNVPLEIVPVSPQVDGPSLPFVYDISMGVRRGDVELRKKVEAALARNKQAIDKILNRYGVPRVERRSVAAL